MIVVENINIGQLKFVVMHCLEEGATRQLSKIREAIFILILDQIWTQIIGKVCNMIFVSDNPIYQILYQSEIIGNVICNISEKFRLTSTWSIIY